MEKNFVDARTEAVSDAIDATICVVGGGAAGITVARTLAATIPGVILIESGGQEPDGDTQNLYSGLNLGLPYYNLAACRMRYFGGSTNAWFGHSRPNDPIDYQGRPELGLPKWPMTAEELAPFVARAAQSLDYATDFFEPRNLFASAGLLPEALIDDRSSSLVTKVFQRTEKLRFATVFGEELGNLANLTIYLHLNATHIQLAHDGRSVVHVNCATLAGRKVRVTAKAFVLCSSGIENARLLLVSNDIMAPGIGNASDHVGRYFMDHIYINASQFVPNATFPLLYNQSVTEPKKLLAEIGFSDDFLRRERLLEYYCEFRPVYPNDAVRRADNRVHEKLMEPGSVQFLNDIATMLADLDDSARYEFARLRHERVPPDYFVLEHRIEQAPNPNSRVVLSDRRDALGGLVADLDWRITDDDIRSLKTGHDTIIAELSALGYGRFRKEDLTPELVTSRVLGHFHEIGTTRMSDEPPDGVVDPNCRVHGVANLYVGGSSVFPSAGYANPTMMIVAFALRIADHIKRAFA